MLGEGQLAAARMDFDGRQLDAVGIVRLRLSEHALHTWDLAAMQDPSATVHANAVELLIDSVPQLHARGRASRRAAAGQDHDHRDPS